MGDRVDPFRDRVEVDGGPVPLDPALRYFAFNKPRGVHSTLRDERGRPDLRGFHFLKGCRQKSPRHSFAFGRKMGQI